MVKHEDFLVRYAMQCSRNRYVMEFLIIQHSHRIPPAFLYYFPSTPQHSTDESENASNRQGGTRNGYTS